MKFAAHAQMSVDLRIQMYTEPVPLKYGKLTTSVGPFTSA